MVSLTLRITVGKGLADNVSFADGRISTASGALFDTPVVEDPTLNVGKFKIRCTLQMSFAALSHLSVTLLTALRCLRIHTIAYGKNQTEFLYMGEQHTFDFDKLCAQSDTSIITDSLAISYSRPDSDSVSVTESFSRVVTSARTFTESATVSDAPALTAGLNKTDAVSISQVFGRTVIFNRTFTDAFTLDDSATVDAFTKDTQARKGNVVGVTDDFSRVFTAIRDFTDSVSASDDPVLNMALVSQKHSA